MTGEIGILNVGAGDTKLSFDIANPEERARACAIVKDMLRRGFYLVIEDGVNPDGSTRHRRVFDFDEARGEYIIKDVAEDLKADEPSTAKGRGKRRTHTLRVDAGATKGVAIARVAGG